uniref:EST1_DNA_bind domain-containing protein n=1 Tax=Steinernema glaseri TaxID=37863 RepID=A0A1I7ZC32_9BILA
MTSKKILHTALELDAMVNKLALKAQSPFTRNILQRATLPQKRIIKELDDDFPLQATLMEWGSRLLQVAIKRGEAIADAFQWKNALVCVMETLRSLKPGYPMETLPDWWFQGNTHVFDHIVSKYVGTVHGARVFLAHTPLPHFFKSLLAFASHFIKHGVPLGETPSSYLTIMEELFKVIPTEENMCDMHRKGGWTLYSSGTEGTLKKAMLAYTESNAKKQEVMQRKALKTTSTSHKVEFASTSTNFNLNLKFKDGYKEDLLHRSGPGRYGEQPGFKGEIAVHQKPTERRNALTETNYYRNE